MNRWIGRFAWVQRKCCLCGIWFDCIAGSPAAEDSTCLWCVLR